MIKPITLNGEQYYRVKHFAALTNRTTQTIYNLIRDGNSVRELKSVHIAENVYIPVSELPSFILVGLFVWIIVWGISKLSELFQRWPV